MVSNKQNVKRKPQRKSRKRSQRKTQRKTQRKSRKRSPRKPQRKTQRKTQRKSQMRGGAKYENTRRFNNDWLKKFLLDIRRKVRGGKKKTSAKKSKSKK